MPTRITAQFQWNHDTASLLKAKNLEKGGRVQQAIDKAVIDWNLLYCPMATGTLARSAYSATQIGSGKVVYPGPYARFQYYGKVMTDENGRVWVRKGEKKPIVTERDLIYSTDLNPLAGPFWFERMKADHKDDILREAKSVAGIK